MIWLFKLSPAPGGGARALPFNCFLIMQFLLGVKPSRNFFDYIGFKARSFEIDSFLFVAAFVFATCYALSSAGVNFTSAIDNVGSP